MIINHNLQALNTYRQLGINTANGAKTTEKLSSGLRINRAGDDAAGLAISEKMRAQIRGLDQASRNAQDGISMIQTTEGALSETHSILQRMRELAVQSSNDTNVSIDRDELQKEMNQLTSEINRIGNTTEFNTQSLLKGKNADVVAKVASNNVIKQGEVGVPVGDLSDLVTTANSVKGVSSTASVQASSSKATGDVSDTTVVTNSTKGANAAVSLTNGITFQAEDFGTSLNGKTIEIKQSTTASTQSSLSIDASGNFTFTIGTNSNNQSLASNRGTLYNELKSAIDNSAVKPGIKVAIPSGTDSALVPVETSGTLTGGVAEVQGKFKISITDKFEEAGDTITIGGKTFTAKTSGADPLKGEFNIATASTSSATAGKLIASADATPNKNYTALSNSVNSAEAAYTNNADFAALGGSTDITLNGQTVALTNTAALDGSGTALTDNDVITALQSDIDAVYDGTANGGVTFSVGITGGKITITNDKTGSANDVDLTGTAVGGTDIANALGFTADDTANTLGGDGTFSADAKMIINVNGTDYTFNKADLAGMFDGTKTAANYATAIQTKIGAPNVTVTATGNRLDIQTADTGSDARISVRFEGTANDKSMVKDALGFDNFANAQGTDAVAANVASTSEQAIQLRNAIANDADLKDKYTVYTNGSDIILEEKWGHTSGTDLADPIVAGSGADDKLLITNNGGQNLRTVTVDQAQTTSAANASTTVGADGNTLTVTAGTGVGTRANNVKIELVQSTDDELRVNFNEGVLKVSLAKTTAANNADDKIQAAIRNLGTVDGIDFSGFTATGSGTWDTATTGASITTGSSSFSGGANATTANQMSVESKNGSLSIHLAGDSATKNTAEKIQKAVQDMGKFYYFDENNKWTAMDFGKFEFKGAGQWDTNTTGNSIIKGNDTFVGGTVEVKGEYGFNIDKAFAAGDTVTINGQTFKAVDSAVVDSSKGEFSIAGGNAVSQASSLRDAIGLNSSLAGKYTVSGSGTEIKLKEVAASGVDLKNSNLAVKATGTQGEYAIALTDLAKDGAVFSIDGKDIQVSDKNTHVGYANGTAIKESASNEDQTKALADAINKNADLSKKYTASVNADGNLVLKQKEGEESATAPDVQYKNSPKGNFTASFQVGANSGQSMTIEVKDMRSAALGISGDGSNGTVAAKDGKVASYVTTANVTDGTTNKNTEFALDISSSEKASAAISVINDAIEQVSGQRSNLGAFQNRLEHTINNLNTSSENLTAAESRIRDVDMAKTVMENTKNSILAQAAQAMLAQANQAPQQVLQLLR